MLHLEKTNHTHNTFACTLGISKFAFLLYKKERKKGVYSEFNWIIYKYIQGNNPPLLWYISFFFPTIWQKNIISNLVFLESICGSNVCNFSTYVFNNIKILKKLESIIQASISASKAHIRQRQHRPERLSADAVGCQVTWLETMSCKVSTSSRAVEHYGPEYLMSF